VREVDSVGPETRVEVGNKDEGGDVACRYVYEGAF